MHVPIHIDSKMISRPAAWTLGHCPHCEVVTAIRIDEVVEQISIFLIPVQRKVWGHKCHCDICNRAITTNLSESRLALAQWHPREGVRRLAERLGHELPDDKPRGDVTVESLLSAVATSTTLKELDITGGLTAGCIVGALIGAALGYWVLPDYLPRMDRLGCVFAGVFGGLSVGGVLGALIHAVGATRSSPYERLLSAVKYYSVDADRLERLADRYPLRVRAAARRARDKAMLLRLRPEQRE